MSEPNHNQRLPVSAYSEEEWAAAIQYAEEHESELRARDLPAPRPLPPPIGNAGQHLFEVLTEHNRALAQFYRLNPPHHGR